jgi:Domain of unknown function (DUF1772)
MQRAPHVWQEGHQPRDGWLSEMLALMLGRFGLRAAGVAQASWLFANLYEAVVGMPQLLLDARHQRRPGLMSAGSPLRYYAPVGPLTVATTAVALVDSWRAGGDRRMIALAATSTGAAFALTGYLVRAVNLKLLSDSAPLPDSERRQIVATWHRANGVRLVAVAGAWLALRRAGNSIR